MKSQGIYPPSVPVVAPFYSPAILAEGQRLLFVSGQGPRDYDVNSETKICQTFEQIQTVLKTAGGTMKNIVIIRAYFLNMARDLPLFRKLRQQFLVEPYPAVTSVGVTELAVPGLEVEIEAIAIL